MRVAVTVRIFIRTPTSSTSFQVRGDPDGCGLDASSQRYSPSSELRVDLPAEDLLNIKKGWLMKQGANKVIGDRIFLVITILRVWLDDFSPLSIPLLD